MAHPDISDTGDTFQIQKFNTTVVCPIIISPKKAKLLQTDCWREREREGWGKFKTLREAGSFV
jgi:hypothetical protein